MAGNRFFFVLCVYFGFLSNHIVFFYAPPKQLCQGVVVFDGREFKSPIVFPISYHDRFTFQSADVLYLYCFSSYSGKHFTDKKN